MDEKNVKLWHLIVAVVAQVVLVSFMFGGLFVRVAANDARITVNSADIKRIDNEGSAVWKNTLKFTDKEAEQLKADLKEVKQELAAQRELLVTIKSKL